MGKKKPTKKTKQLSVAIAEASSAADDEQQQQQQPQITPRKRGRPRKVVEKAETVEAAAPEKTADAAEEEKGDAIINESELKKVKISEDEEKKFEAAGESSKEPPRGSRARRKSKPRKSS